MIIQIKVMIKYSEVSGFKIKRPSSGLVGFDSNSINKNPPQKNKSVKKSWIRFFFVRKGILLFGMK
jgi:hypothetical protein